MLNFPIDREVLIPHAPRGTEVDAWNGTAFVSLVGFRFSDTRVKGLPIPFHRNFDEINLRFYVRYRGSEGWRRGVVFVREVVPRPAIALMARWMYNENYVACPTRSEIQEPTVDRTGSAEYKWKYRGDWLTIGAEYRGESAFPAAGSEEEFITEHYWGYSSQRDGSSVEYRVEHPQWRVWSATAVSFNGDISSFCGAEFAASLGTKPSSVFVADGSPIVVRHGARLGDGDTT